MKGARVIGVLALPFLASAAAGMGAWKRPAKQPIAFNHQKHVAELSMECTDCHLHAIDGVRATIPNLSVCSQCHEDPQTEGAEEALVVKYVQEGVPIPWQKVFWVPDHVYFSHRRHTGIGKIDCAACHGNVGDRVQPLTSPLMRMNMATCIKCHERSNVSTDCVVCHK